MREGLEEGRQVLFISDMRPQELRAPGIDDNLFDDWRLPLTAELKKDQGRCGRLLPARTAQRGAVEDDLQ
jgi:hypothetical protein